MLDWGRVRQYCSNIILFLSGLEEEFAGKCHIILLSSYQQRYCLLRGREYQLCDRLGDFLRKRTLNDRCSVLNGRLEKERTRAAASRSAQLGSKAPNPKHEAPILRSMCLDFFWLLPRMGFCMHCQYFICRITYHAPPQ